MEVLPESFDNRKGEPDAQIEQPKPVDSVIHISIVDGGLRAYLKIEPPANGGAAPTLQALLVALANQGVSHNVDVEKLNNLAANPVYNQSILIASGTPPVDGEDGVVRFHIKTEKTALRPKISANDRADYHDLDIVENVTQGQVLCTITLPTDGTPGITVQGKALTQTKGRPVKSLVGRNTELIENGTAIVAKIGGQVEFDGRKINVAETFYVKENVDFSTGDIKVIGNVVVSGMVLPGFKVEASGNVDIRGAVENAYVKAGGNVKIQSGVINSELYCAGDLKCRYIENSKIFAKYDIKTESIINSDVKCGKSIKVTGSIAKIIGGRCFAGQDIEARTIGAVSHIKTNLEIGTDETVIERQQELVTKLAELGETNKKLASIISIMRQMEAGNRLTAENREVLNNADFSYNANNSQIEQATSELDEITRSIREKGAGRVICSGEVHPGVRVEIGGANININQMRQNVMLYNKEGEICIGPAR